MKRRVFSSLLSDLNLSDHHIHSFDDCISEWLPDIILQNGNIETIQQDAQGADESLYMFTLENYRFLKPDMPPSGAHVYNVSYVGDIVVDIRETVYSKKESERLSEHADFPYVHKDKLHRDMKLCSFPIMLYSAACHFSNGSDLSYQVEPEYAGSFISRGKRRFIPLLKSMVTNYPFRFYNKNKQLYIIEVRSEHLDRKHRSTSTLELQMAHGPTKRHQQYTAFVKIPFLKPLVTLAVVVQALGWSASTFEDAVQSALGALWDPSVFHKYFIMYRHDHKGCSTQDEALLHISGLYGKNNTHSSQYVLRSEILPHMNDACDDSAKLFYLAYLYGQLVLLREGRLEPTNRDSRVFSRLTSSGTSLAILFRMKFLKFIKQSVKFVRRVLTQDPNKMDVAKIYNHELLTKKILPPLATGQWSKKRKGVSHPMMTMNDNAIISQVRRISSSFLNHDGKHVEPRMVQGTAFGYECAAETPEGEACGLVYSMACLARVTRGSDPHILMEYFIDLAGHLITHYPNKPKTADDYKLFDPQGKFFGWCTDINELNRLFFNARRALNVDPYVTRHQDNILREFRLHCDTGRQVRPLLVLSNIHKLPQLVAGVVTGTSLIPDLLVHGCLEYVSPAEEQELKITHKLPLSGSVDDGSTHLEVNDVSLVGVIGALTPFFRHNQGPRLVYWVGMSKQTIGSSRKQDRGAATTHNLWYGQRAIVATQAARDLNMDQTPDCCNFVVALYALPWNQEDAFVVKKSSIERDMSTSSSTRIYVSKCKGSEQFENPTVGQTFAMKDSDYSHLQSNGLPRMREKLRGTDVVIGKTVPIKKISASASVHVPQHSRTSEYQKRRRDNSVQVRKDEGGVVVSTEIVKRPEGDLAKVGVQTTRVPQIGDKFSSRHGQKGTIGMVLPQEDLPFAMATGMVPDAFISPLGIISRMTMGKVLEIVLGKAVAISGDLMHGLDDQDFETSGKKRMETIRKVFQRAGFNFDGTEVFCDGRTGEIIRVPIMCGVIPYSKLNHMVERKAYARSTGPVNMLTRQPNDGRRNEGGLRFGQMETDCVIAHAGAAVLEERMLSTSDKFECYVCASCGLLDPI